MHTLVINSSTGTPPKLLKVLFPVSGKHFSLSSWGRKLALRGGNRWEGGRKWLKMKAITLEGADYVLSLRLNQI